MWQDISIAPDDRDLQLAVIDGNEQHVLVFPCRRRESNWYCSTSGQSVDVDPTHWREWED